MSAEGGERREGKRGTFFYFFPTKQQGWEFVGGGGAELSLLKKVLLLTPLYITVVQDSTTVSFAQERGKTESVLASNDIA